MFDLSSMSVYFNQTNISPGTSFSSGGGSNYTLPANIMVSTITGQKNTTGVFNPTYNPINFTLRPDLAANKGTNYIQVTWDAVDTGANTALVAGADASGAFIYSFWPGFVSMPLTLGGQDVTISSDNETFLFGEGKAGAIGSLSTGVQFLSAQNTMSSIQDPTKQYNADLTALLSTFKDLYPTCFAP